MATVAECVIQWNDTKETESVLISLDGHDDEDIFFVCYSENEFRKLTNDGFGDFTVLEFSIN